MCMCVYACATLCHISSMISISEINSSLNHIFNYHTTSLSFLFFMVSPPPPPFNNEK
eukprot:m.3220 g.3220  ORF g.3220 m.3220 type:complete len:57 (-) comp2033_c0_seq1:143-313(-)